ncbi:MAG: hypothetical protein Q9Q40_05615 [Acidobacteriota bacterium]|nr:hypothetical protein [Acidobacteriota bacterium]MDQ7087771.1 hypothetical protein [Acidobacteriota bacterium]
MGSRQYFVVGEGDGRRIYLVGETYWVVFSVRGVEQERLGSPPPAVADEATPITLAQARALLGYEPVEALLH